MSENIIMLNRKGSYVAFLFGFFVGQYIRKINVLPIHKKKIKVCFSPNGGCQDLLIQKIKKSKKNIFVAIYSFTSEPIANALINASQRGVNVCILTDRLQSRGKNSQIRSLALSGIPIHIDRAKVGHNKIVIIDKKYIFTGSYNFSKNAEKYNAENLIFIPVQYVAEDFYSNFNMRYTKGKLFYP